jgi:hypothetical protein
MTYRRKAFLMHDVDGLLGVLDAAVAQAQEAAPPGRKISRQGLARELILGALAAQAKRRRPRP